MERMIRKQLYLGAEQQRKLDRLARRWGCTEAHVVRIAIDRIPDPDASIDERLADAGLLVPPTTAPDLPEGEAVADLERAHEDWLSAQAGSLRLAEAVIEDRR